ncbi:MAG: hypothetical protein H6813_00680 [Phycisphaeraceae bacterium]|nr:hypothetical protein [Phycisphaeraceae bacterium]MCB9847399.1 hypothetical protein [Phycisphaeraceae bacterium]
MTQRNLSILLFVLFVTDAFVVGALVSVTASPAIGIPVALGVVVFPFLLMRVIAFAMGRIGTLARLSRAFPLRDGAFPADGSARIASISLGTKSMRINNGVVLAADDECLHIKLAIPTVANGAGASIPWEQVEHVLREKRTAELRLFDGAKLWVPWRYAEKEWALREAITAG